MTTTDLTTRFLSETDGSSSGTFCRMSPELLDPDRFAHTAQVLTGLRPFHHIHACMPIPAILRGVRPEKPPHTESLGFSDTLWGLVQLCWSEISSTRPAAWELLDHFHFVSPTWVPPILYPTVMADPSSVTDSNSSYSFSATTTSSMQVEHR